MLAFEANCNFPKQQFGGFQSASFAGESVRAVNHSRKNKILLLSNAVRISVLQIRFHHITIHHGGQIKSINVIQKKSQSIVAERCVNLELGTLTLFYTSNILIQKQVKYSRILSNIYLPQINDTIEFTQIFWCNFACTIRYLKMISVGM